MNRAVPVFAGTIHELKGTNQYIWLKGDWWLVSSTVEDTSQEVPFIHMILMNYIDTDENEPNLAKYMKLTTTPNKIMYQYVDYDIEFIYDGKEEL